MFIIKQPVSLNAKYCTALITYTFRDFIIADAHVTVVSLVTSSWICGSLTFFLTIQLILHTFATFRVVSLISINNTSSKFHNTSKSKMFQCKPWTHGEKQQYNSTYSRCRRFPAVGRVPSTEHWKGGGELCPCRESNHDSLVLQSVTQSLYEVRQRILHIHIYLQFINYWMKPPAGITLINITINIVWHRRTHINCRVLYTLTDEYDVSTIKKVWIVPRRKRTTNLEWS
jgi:hypothetical protein